MPSSPTWSQTNESLEAGTPVTPNTGNGLVSGPNVYMRWQDTNLSPNRYFQIVDTGNAFKLQTSTDGVVFTDLWQITDVTQATVYNRVFALTIDQNNMAAPTALAWRVIVGSEANPRFQVDTGGTMSWGAGGGSAVDTVVSRVAAAVLQATGNIRGTVAPSNVADLTRKDYVDTGLALKLALAGGTMTGALTLSADPTAGLQAATKQYVDAKVSQNPTVFTGAGAPSATTLSASITYNVGNLYWDTTNFVFYVCKTAGTNATSVWTPANQVFTSAGMVLQQTTANYTLLWNNPAAARTLTIPDPGASDTFAFLAATQTFTNKTLSAAVLSGATTMAAAATLAFPSGTPIKGHLSATATLTFAAIAAQTTAELTITVTGAAVGDNCYASPQAAIGAAFVWCAWVSAANTVTVRVGNITTASATPTAVTWRADVWQH